MWPGRRRGLAAGRVRACAAWGAAAAAVLRWGLADWGPAPAWLLVLGTAVLRWGVGTGVWRLGAWDEAMSALAAGTGAREGKAGRELGNLGLGSWASFLCFMGHKSQFGYPVDIHG